MHHDDTLLGTQIAHFRIDSLLGSGHLGTVYLGYDTVLDRPVAIKRFSSELDPVRGLAAARRIARWWHPHIIRIHYADHHNNQFSVVMDYISGQNLGSLIEEYETDGQLMPYAHVLVIGTALARALDYAHHQGIIHRMVYPQNVLIGEDDAIVLTDFSLALDQHRGTVGHPLTTLVAAAPEQMLKSHVALPASDQYALGVIIYRLITGQPPFTGMTALDVALQHLNAIPPTPSYVNQLLPEAIDAVFRRVLAKEPSERYPSCLAFLDDVALALEPTPVSALPSTRHTLSRPLSEQTADPLVGHQLGAYRVERVLGAGGMARIYAGHDSKLRRQVAIKVIDLPYQADSTYRLRFEREAQTIAQLDHPNIVQLYAYDEQDGLLYMVMQYVEGSNLQTLIQARRQRQQPFTPSEILQLMRNIGFALDHAHQKGIIHRDIHPGNILLNANGRAILTDFGLALMTAVGTRGEIFGTPTYMAPEQARSSAEVAPQSDLYALGVILFELLTDQVPFEAPTPIDVAMLHMTQTPASIRSIKPSLSPALEAVVAKALAKHPVERYPTGKAFAAAVAAAIEQE